MFLSRSSTPDRSLPQVLRVGLFGILGAGNLGNDGSMESVLQYLRCVQPEPVVDALCSGPDRLIEHYGIAAMDISWRVPTSRSLMTLPLRALAKVAQVFAIAAWVRRHDVVVVPGAGVLEASLPTRPWQLSYALVLLCLWGRVFGTKVALVSVGACTIKGHLTRWLSNASARLAYYRSYRDAFSREVMRQRGVQTSDDHVYADLVFALPTPPDDLGNPERVAIGVMGYYGSNDDRSRAAELHRSYVEKMKELVHQLIETGRRVTLVTGDSVNDTAVLQEVAGDARARHPGLDPSWLVAERATTLEELMDALHPSSAVIAIRFHNIVAALKLGKPTISIGYSAKHDVLMADMGLSEFCQSAHSLDIDRLVDQLADLQDRASELRPAIKARTSDYADLVREQFEELTDVLFSTTRTPIPNGRINPADQPTYAQAAGGIGHDVPVPRAREEPRRWIHVTARQVEPS
jgi:polysaccharide pyruvyl transferase WcaK-like protein